METYPDKETCIKHLDMILAGKNLYKDIDEAMVKKYEKQFQRYRDFYYRTENLWAGKEREKKWVKTLDSAL